MYFLVMQWRGEADRVRNEGEREGEREREKERGRERERERALDDRGM